MTTPVRPAEPAEPTTLTFSRVLTVDEARQVRDLLIRFSDVQDELAAARVEAASLREQLDDLYRVWRRDRGAWRARLSAVEGERAGLYGEESYKMLREQHELACEKLTAAEGERDEAKHEAAELRGLVKRWAAVDEETGLCLCYEPAVECDADGACPGGESRAWLAAHPLKTEGDGGTPTTETKGQP